MAEGNDSKWRPELPREIFVNAYEKGQMVAYRTEVEGLDAVANPEWGKRHTGARFVPADQQDDKASQDAVVDIGVRIQDLGRIRDACRNRRPVGGLDAETLDYAITRLEEQRDYERRERGRITEELEAMREPQEAYWMPRVWVNTYSGLSAPAYPDEETARKNASRRALHVALPYVPQAILNRLKDRAEKAEKELEGLRADGLPHQWATWITQFAKQRYSVREELDELSKRCEDAQSGLDMMCEELSVAQDILDGPEFETVSDGAARVVKERDAALGRVHRLENEIPALVAGKVTELVTSEGSLVYVAETCFGVGSEEEARSVRDRIVWELNNTVLRCWKEDHTEMSEEVAKHLKDAKPNERLAADAGMKAKLMGVCRVPAGSLIDEITSSLRADVCWRAEDRIRLEASLRMMSEVDETLSALKAAAEQETVATGEGNAENS